MPYYGTYKPNYYQPMQGYQQQPMINQPIGQQNMQQNGQQAAPQANFVCRPVASKEEALGVPVDFMGNPMFFPDLAHGVIYVKQFNTTNGTADLFEFHGQQKQMSTPSFAPLDEFNNMKETIQQLKAEIEQLKKPAGRAKKNDVSDE